MPVTFVNVASSAPSSAAQSVTVTCPSGVTTGNLMLFFAANSIASGYSSTPSGWTKVTAPSSNSSDTGSCCWYKIATSSDVAGSTTYTATPGSGTSGTVGVILAYSGFDATKFPLASSEYGLAHTTSASTSSGSPTNPTATVQSTDLDLRVYICGQDTASQNMTMTPPTTGWTSRAKVIANTSTYNTGIAVLDRIGSTDTSACTASAQCMWDIYTLYIPAAPATNNDNFLAFFM
jgi:hypothetical protein